MPYQPYSPDSSSELSCCVLAFLLALPAVWVLIDLALDLEAPRFILPFQTTNTQKCNVPNKMKPPRQFFSLQSQNRARSPPRNSVYIFSFIKMYIKLRVLLFKYCKHALRVSPPTVVAHVYIVSQLNTAAPKIFGHWPHGKQMQKTFKFRVGNFYHTWNNTPSSNFPPILQPLFPRKRSGGSLSKEFSITVPLLSTVFTSLFGRNA